MPLGLPHEALVSKSRQKYQYRDKTDVDNFPKCEQYQHTYSVGVDIVPKTVKSQYTVQLPVQ